ncbi:hypothetical protein GCM10010176_081380 [Nonomuraea spiralis]|nr:hypothetical protein GCM10010176_081380 [Nonomuraea spiralis]
MRLRPAARATATATVTDPPLPPRLYGPHRFPPARAVGVPGVLSGSPRAPYGPYWFPPVRAVGVPGPVGRVCRSAAYSPHWLALVWVGGAPGPLGRVRPAPRARTASVVPLVWVRS